MWHPPFIIHTAISIPKLSKSTAGESKDSLVLRQKDAYVSIENLDIKGKRKLLAKARLNLSEYFESAAEKDVSFRLKLHPESSKIESASIDLTLRKSVKDPRTGLPDIDVPSAPFSDDPGKDKYFPSIILKLPLRNSFLDFFRFLEEISYRGA